MSTEEATAENGSEEVKTEVKTYSAEQFNGLLADKQAEVKKRQDAEKLAAQLQEQLSQVKSRPSRETEGDDEDNKPLTMAQFRKLLAEQKKADEETAFAQRQTASEKKLATELTAESCGEGLDYASVIAAGEKNLTEGDKLAIRQADNPAMEKYRRCILLTPELIQKQEEVRTSRLLEKIKLTGRVPASGGGDSDRKVSTADVSRMSEEELDRLAESLG
jgi:hypothetical protein